MDIINSKILFPLDTLKDYETEFQLKDKHEAMLK